MSSGKLIRRLTPPPRSVGPRRFDLVTIALHWTTVALIVGMFASGSAEPQPKVVRIMAKIAQILKAHPGAIMVRGHTDSRPYKSATYDNWRLSSARAQMAYYMLIRGGLPEKRFERVEGYANHSLKDPSHPLAAENRRIEILVREAKP